jgi:hypothetical protein
LIEVVEIGQDAGHHIIYEYRVHGLEGEIRGYFPYLDDAAAFNDYLVSFETVQVFRGRSGAVDSSIAPKSETPNERWSRQESNMDNHRRKNDNGDGSGDDHDAPKIVTPPDP